ncbi:MAG: DUF4377 domain-containing protein [Bacteroidia bacterium]
MKRYLILLLLILGGFANTIAQSQTDSTSIIEVKISPWKTLHYGAFFKQLGLTSSIESCNSIEGFEFEWGNYYTLEVKKTILANPPMDGSSVKYNLNKVKSKTPATGDMVFQMRLEFDRYLGNGENEDLIVKKEEDIYVYDRDIEIHIPEDMKAEWRNFYEARKDANALFTFQVKDGILFRGTRK